MSNRTSGILLVVVGIVGVAFGLFVLHEKLTTVLLLVGVPVLAIGGSLLIRAKGWNRR